MINAALHVLSILFFIEMDSQNSEDGCLLQGMYVTSLACTLCSNYLSQYNNIHICFFSDEHKISNDPQPLPCVVRRPHWGL